MKSVLTIIFLTLSVSVFAAQIANETDLKTNCKSGCEKCDNECKGIISSQSGKSSDYSERKNTETPKSVKPVSGEKQ
jgi:hypothetical protein